jgi:hypothetical protein
MTSKIRPEGYPSTPKEIAWEEAKSKASASAWGEARNPNARLKELRRKKWEKEQEARDLASAEAYARGAARAEARSKISGIHPVIFVVIGWILLSLVSNLVLTAAGYKEEPSRNNGSPWRMNDPTHPCYGLTAQECKWN